METARNAATMVNYNQLSMGFLRWVKIGCCLGFLDQLKAAILVIFYKWWQWGIVKYSDVLFQVKSKTEIWSILGHNLHHNFDSCVQKGEEFRVTKLLKPGCVLLLSVFKCLSSTNIPYCYCRQSLRKCLFLEHSALYWTISVRLFWIFKFLYHLKSA